MPLARTITASLAALLAACTACAAAAAVPAGAPASVAAGVPDAAAGEGSALSYRDAYRAMVVFDKYGGPKHLLQQQLQVLPAELGAVAGAPGNAGEGLQLTLAGKTTRLHLPLDPLGRTVFPLQKAAYDENAALALNRNGAFTLRPRVTIALRADGIYDSADLRSACAQALDFARYADASQRGRQCGAVRFVFARNGSGGVRLRREGMADQALPALPGAAFAGEPDTGFPTVTWRFGAVAERAQLVTTTAPLAIVPVFD